MTADLPLLTRDGKLILISLLLNSVPIGFMDVVPLVYLLQVGDSPSLIGLIFSVSAISNTVGLIPAGLLADRYGRKKFLIAGSFLPFISYTIFALTLDPYWLIVASAIGGVGLAGGLGLALNSPAILPLLANTTSERNRTNLFGVEQGAWTVALTIGSLLASLPAFLLTVHITSSSFDAHSISYLVMAVLVLASLVPLFFVAERRAEQRTDAPKKKSNPLRRMASGREIGRFSVILALAGLGLGISVQLLPTWYDLKFGTSETLAGQWIAIAEIASIASLVSIPRLVRWRGTLVASAGTGVVSAIFLGAMPLAPTFAGAATLFVGRSVFVNIYWPVMQSYMMGVVVEKERASALGIATTAWGVSNALGTIVGGVLLGLRLLALPFYIAFFAYVGSALAMLVFYRGASIPEEAIVEIKGVAGMATTSNEEKK